MKKQNHTRKYNLVVLENKVDLRTVKKTSIEEIVI